MKSIPDTQNIRRLLKRAWMPFFHRFGKLTPIQLACIPKVMDGRNVVVASPTASGKTEAILAPVAELFLERKWNDLAILYIVPTRALANDTLERISGPLSDMGITTVLKHGDKPHFSLKVPPNCLITTPESLDSIIARRPHLLLNLQVLILDEIHLLDNTYRGDQLRILIERLRSITQNNNFSIHLMSATLSEPDTIALRYVTSFEVVKVAGQREINTHILASHDEVYHLARENNWNKLLYFCNLRESVETVSAELSRIWHPYPVLAHHGSLDRKLREDAEEVIKQSQVAVCVATSTLEMGIDIGDIDLIVLAEVPWSVSALIQRVGRGKRRENLIQAAAISKSIAEKKILESMFKLAKNGTLTVGEYKPDLSVIVQQIFSCLYQSPQGVDEQELSEILSPLIIDDQLRKILSYLHQREWIERRLGHWFASTRLMVRGDRGYIHSNIPDTQTYQVIDLASGKSIGIIAGMFDDLFILGRTTWKVESVASNKIYVRRFSGKASSPLFRRNKNVGAFFYLLPPELRDIM